MGGAAHADDIRTIATSKDTISAQINIINSFTHKHHLRLNSEKTEIVKITCQPYHPEQISLAQCNTNITTIPEAKCLGTWWSSNLSALCSVQENICKARRVFFAFGKIDAFQGHLNPLSAVSIFKTCVIPILLYGCETWLLDSSTILLLEHFQLEIGRRILKLPKWFSGKVVRICLELPSVACLLLLHKINFLAKLLSTDNNSVSSKVLTSAIISDPINVSIIQQCRMLESIVGVSILDECLESPDTAIHLVKAHKTSILRTDMESLLSSAADHPTACHVARVASEVSWYDLWDMALTLGARGTTQLQHIVYHLSQPIYDSFYCSLCHLHIQPTTSWLSHLCSSHQVILDSKTLSEQDIWTS